MQLNYRKNQKAYLYIIMAVAFIFRVAVLMLSENAVSDELEAYSRLNITWDWLSRTEVFPDCNYSTLYFYFLRFLFLISENIFFLRSASLLMGLLTLWVFFKFVENAFSAKNALFSTAIVACLPLAVSLSTVTLPMIIFVLFALLGFYLLFLYTNFSNKKKIKYLILSAVCFTLSAGFRFEGFGLIFFVVVFMALFRVRRFYWFIPFSMIFPSIYMSVSYYKTKHILAAVANSADHVGIIMKNFPHSERIYSYIQSLAGVMTPGLLLFSVFGLIAAFFAVSRLRFIVSVVVAYNCLFLVKSYQGTFLTYLDRYFLLNAILLLPFAIYFCEFVYLRTRKQFMRKFLYFIGISCFVLLFPFFVYQNYIQAVERKVPLWTDDVVSWYNQNAIENAYVFLDRFEHPYMLISMNAARYHFPSLPFGIDSLDPILVKKAINQYRPCYIFSYNTPDNAMLWGVKQALEADTEKDRLLDKIHPVYQNEKWTIYFYDKDIKS